MSDLGVFIGRFQPFHKGHEKVIDYALSQVKTLLILCGSSEEIRTTKNPFLFYERKNFIKSSLVNYKNNIYIMPLKDYPNNDLLWKKDVYTKVLSYANSLNKKNIYLIGHRKDETSFYLDLFPEWEMIWVDNFFGISATPIRQYYFENPKNDLSNLPINAEVRNFLLSFRRNVEYSKLRMDFIKNKS